MRGGALECGAVPRARCRCGAARCRNLAWCGVSADVGAVACGAVRGRGVGAARSSAARCASADVGAERSSAARCGAARCASADVGAVAWCGARWRAARSSAARWRAVARCGASWRELASSAHGRGAVARGAVRWRALRMAGVRPLPCGWRAAPCGAARWRAARRGGVRCGAPERPHDPTPSHRAVSSRNH